MQRIIHRANGGAYPENTLEAIKWAVKADAEGIEIDIQLSKDDVPMVFHYPHLRRLTGRNSLLRELSVTELKSLIVSSKNSDKSGTIPTLEEAIEILKGKKMFYIELKKGDSDKIAESVLNVLKKRLSEDSFTLSSFDPNLIKAVKAKNEQIRTGYIFSTKLRRFFLNRTEKQVGGFDQWHIENSLLNERLLKKAGKRNRELMVWKVNSEVQMKRCIELGVDGIITDNITKLNEVLSG
ncbi:glycerophosphodiester phosphodiesterase [Candidatus Marinimicrobia bacterium MT.SAG.4]|nr:glycerophosphodiester phosphodiesterase [Candidatus Marinimicrobia bacterium MT.SAG.4]